MKVTTNEGPQEPIVEVVKPVRKEKKLVGSKRLKKGHKLFSINMSTGEVAQKKYDMVKIPELNKPDKLRMEVITEENHIYFSALNIKNAIKHARKIVNGLEKVVSTQ